MAPLQSDSPPFHRYWQGQVWPRRRQIFLHRHILISVVVTVVVVLLCASQPVGRLQISSVAGAALGYAALSFGACVTGAVLALTLPSEERVRRLATSGRKDSDFSHYSDLVFNFTWSAMAQLILVLAVAFAYLLGGDTLVWPTNPLNSHIALLCIAVFTGAYSVIRLFSVLYTMSQVAAVIIADIARPAQLEADKSPAAGDAT